LSSYFFFFVLQFKIPADLMAMRVPALMQMSGIDMLYKDADRTVIQKTVLARNDGSQYILYPDVNHGEKDKTNILQFVLVLCHGRGRHYWVIHSVQRIVSGIHRG
jgi:dienelactone hydrolase